MKNKQILMSVFGAGMIALTSCQTSEKSNNVKEITSTQISEENMNNEEQQRESVIKKVIYGYYDAINRLNGEDLYSYLALDGELKEGTKQSAINILQEELDPIEEEILVKKYTLLESDKNTARAKVTLRLTESGRSYKIVSKLILEDDTWKIKSGKFYDLVIQEI